MAAGITTEVKPRPGRTGAGGGNGGPGDDGGGRGRADGPNDWPPGWSHDDAIQPAKYRIGMWVGLASILMLFVSLTSAYILRQTVVREDGTSDWVSIDMPPVLWFSTAVLVASSLSFELSRRSLKRSDYRMFNAYIALTALLGFAFLLGQVIAWRQLAGQGIYLSSNPHSSFVYLMTSLHAIHLVGGLIALCYVAVAALRMRMGIRKRNAVEITALYWHFMDVLWIYIFVLLFFWR